MRVAVIIPAFDAAATLHTALASVSSQTLSPVEVVIADDGSTDETVAIANDWSDRLPIRLVATGARGAGPAVARRTAIDASTSEMVALLDADDVWLPDHLSAMRDAYATTDDGLASADALAWVPGSKVGRPLSVSAPLPAPADQLGWLLTENLLSISALFSRARYDAVGGFRPQFRGTEDWDLWIRMVRAGTTIARPAIPTVLYRLSGSALSSDDAMISARRAVLDAVEAEGSDGERAYLRVASRHNVAAAQLASAYRLADEGQSMAARRAGIRALRGIRPVALRGLAMAAAPRTVAQRRRAVRFDPDVWLRRYGA